MLISAKDLCYTTPVKHSSSMINEDLNYYSLEVMREANEEYRNILLSLYQDGMIQEGFSFDLSNNFSFSNIGSKIIDIFVKTIKRICQRALDFIISLFSKSRQISMYKNLLSKYDRRYKPDFPVFKYTYSDTLTSAETLNLRFKDESQSIQVRLKDIDDNALSMSKEERIQRYKDITAGLIDRTLNSDYYNLARGDVFVSNHGKPEFVDEEDYLPRLFAIMRDGKSEPEMKSFSTTEIQELYDRYNTKKKEKEIKRDRDSIEKAADSAKAQLQILEITPTTKTSNEVKWDSEIMSARNNLLREKCQEITKLCDIYLQAYTQKLNAAQDETKQAMKVLLSIIHDHILEEENHDK